MRPFSVSKPTWWTGPTGRALSRLAREAKDDPAGYTQALELRTLGGWLQTGSQHNQYGLYYAPEVILVDETGLRSDRLPSLWKALNLLEFCTYDRETSWVWVYEMARHQLDLPFNGQDNRIKAAANWYRALPDNPFLGPFFDRYRNDMRLVHRREGRASQAPSKGLVPDHDLVQDPVQLNGKHGGNAAAQRGKHRGHVLCGTRLCLPAFLFDEFKGQLGAAWSEGQIEDWAREIDAAVTAEGRPIDDPLVLWRREFKAAVKDLIQASKSGSRGPSWRDRCPHHGICVTANQCAERSSRDGAITFTAALTALLDSPTGDQP